MYNKVGYLLFPIGVDMNVFSNVNMLTSLPNFGETIGGDYTSGVHTTGS